jgi:hypothetical protein
MSGMKQIDIDTNANTVTIGPGVLFGDLWDPLYEQGKEIGKYPARYCPPAADKTASGSCSSTSVIGVTIGGGVGRYQTYHGLLIDQLLSVRIALANGDVVTASATDNPDLFWGIRGGGAHLGIISQATYRTADLTNGGEVQVADMLFSLDVAEPFFDALKALESSKPHGFIVTVYAFFNPETNTVSFTLLPPSRHSSYQHPTLTTPSLLARPSRQLHVPRPLFHLRTPSRALPLPRAARHSHPSPPLEPSNPRQHLRPGRVAGHEKSSL